MVRRWTIRTHGRTSGRGGQQRRCGASSSAALPRLPDDLAPQRRPTCEPVASRPEMKAEAGSHASTIRDMRERSRGWPEDHCEQSDSGPRNPALSMQRSTLDAAPARPSSTRVTTLPPNGGRDGLSTSDPSGRGCEELSALRGAVPVRWRSAPRNGLHLRGGPLRSPSAWPSARPPGRRVRLERATQPDQSAALPRRSCHRMTVQLALAGAPDGPTPRATAIDVLDGR